MPKIEELVDRSKGKIRADVVHRKITAMGYRGSERSTRRAVAEVKEAWHAGKRRRYRPWIPEPAMWLQRAEHANPEGTIYVITDNLSSHDSKSTRAWLEDHPRIRHAFIPKRACWLNMQEGWWRIFRQQALAGQDFADPDEIAHATRVATAQLNARARPWIWGRPEPKPRSYRKRFIYTL
jgi:hypothetical protein